MAESKHAESGTAGADPALAAILGRIDAGLPAARGRLFEFLRIPSISADPAYRAECRRAAEFARALLEEMGFAAALAETAGQPAVIAHHPGPGPGPAAPRVLFYGHYDVQPADPVALWSGPPFEPRLVEGPRGPRIVARGAVDDKGQVMGFLEACRATLAQGEGLPVALTVLLEGEEECGSPSLEALLAERREELAADFALISDTNLWRADIPALTTRLRGLVYLQIDLDGPSRDLHSGLFGGAVVNPLQALTRILGALHDAAGRVAIPGFYDGVREISAEEAAIWRGLPFSESAFLAEIGLAAPAPGEAGRSTLERLWARPTAEINGIWGGYTGAGAKTVIPASAHAKLSFRLVPDQDPEAVIAGLEAFVAARLPPGARVHWQRFGASPGIAVATDRPWLAAARRVLAEEFGREAVLIGSGGSIPVVEALRRHLGLETLLMGFGLDDDRIHSPDEKFEQACFHHAMRAHARLLHALGQGPAGGQR